jgi:multidrug efflux pump subunit AcrA (membrane-fusion protein)
MRKLFLATALLSALGMTGTALGDEDRPEHYEGKPAETLAEARANLTEANAELREFLAQDELSGQDMARIHELSYTMENAVKRLRTELAAAAEALEAIHLAAESTDPGTVWDRAPGYLDVVDPLAD